MHVPATSFGDEKNGDGFYVAKHSRESSNGACSAHRAYSFGAMYLNNGWGCCSGLVASKICRSVCWNQSIAKCVEKFSKTMKNEAV